MKKIACFSIPAHGHTNPMLPIVKELVSRGNRVRFYSFEEFREKIEKTGAEFVPCDDFLPKLDEEEEKRLKKISTTEMALQDLRATANMDGFLEKEMKELKPDVIYTDSVCFWGKLTAHKYNVPMVVSTSTFAFNQFSSQYMKNSPAEMADMIFGLPKLSKELKKLEPYGYHVKSTLSLVQSDNSTDSVVYASRRFQPCSKTFSEHYSFVGPSVFSKAMPVKEKPRKLLYVSLGTIINERPDFYKRCVSAFGNTDLDVIISCGNAVDENALGVLPENVKVYNRVDQLEVLSRADAFITHCGMNSVSESLYMATPMILYPQTSEQRAVARRAFELNSGVYLKDDSEKGIIEAVRRVLETDSYKEWAAKLSEDFRSCKGAVGAAEFIETAPHEIPKDQNPLKAINAKIGLRQLLYWAVAVTIIVLTSVSGFGKYGWVIGLSAGILNEFYRRFVTKRILKSLEAPL